jgi:hypothetical protein
MEETMLKQMTLYTVLFVVAIVGPSLAQSTERADSVPMASVVEIPERPADLTAVAPDLQDETTINDADLPPLGIWPTPAALTAIVSWLSAYFDIPASNDLPRVERAPTTKLAALHYQTLLPERSTNTAAPQQMIATAQENIIAIYDVATRTIYVREEWQGRTPAEMSILVHEMVHHLQNLAGLKYTCPQEREKLAYAAQDRWLRQFGRSLLKDFEIDGMWLLVRTNCLD